MPPTRIESANPNQVSYLLVKQEIFMAVVTV